MSDEMAGGDLPSTQREQRPSTPLEAEAGIEVVYAPNQEDLELQDLEENTPSNPWSVVSTEEIPPLRGTEKLDPLQLTRVEETGLDTNRVTQRIERLLDPVEGNQKDDPGKIIIRLLRRTLRRLAALEKGMVDLDARMEKLENSLLRIEMQLPKIQELSPEDPGPLG